MTLTSHVVGGEIDRPSVGRQPRTCTERLRSECCRDPQETSGFPSDEKSRPSDWRAIWLKTEIPDPDCKVTAVVRLCEDYAPQTVCALQTSLSFTGPGIHAIRVGREGFTVIPTPRFDPRSGEPEHRSRFWRSIPFSSTEGLQTNWIGSKISCRPNGRVLAHRNLVRVRLFRFRPPISIHAPILGRYVKAWLNWQTYVNGFALKE